MPLTCSPVVLALLLLAQVVRAKNDCGTRACGSPSMAWGAKAGAADWCRRLQDNDKTLTSLLVMRTRAMTSADWVEFCAALADNTALRELKASSHKLDSPALSAFSRMLARNTALERLALGDAELGDAGVALICDGLAANTVLKEIELDYKGLTPVGATALADALKKNGGLRRLVLSRNPDLGDAGVRALCECLCESSVRDLQLEEVGMGDEGARALALALARSNTRMQEISLCGNEALSGEGTGALVDAFLSGAGVESLKLDYCPQALSGNGSEKLQQLLQATSSPLHRLSIHTVIPPEESRAVLAAAVGASTALLHAKLINMDLGDAGVACLSEALSANPSSGLQVLDVTGNQATGDAAACLFLSGNAPLAKVKRLVLFDNRVGTGASLPKLLEEAAQGGREVGVGLEDLDLGGNKLEKAWILELLSALYACPGLFPALRTLGLGGNEGMQDADPELEAAVEALQERAVPLDVVYKAMGDDGKAAADARASQLVTGADSSSQN